LEWKLNKAHWRQEPSFTSKGNGLDCDCTAMYIRNNPLVSPELQLWRTDLRGGVSQPLWGFARISEKLTPAPKPAKGCPNLLCPVHLRVPGQGKFSIAVPAQPPRSHCSTSWESHSRGDALSVPGPREGVNSGNPEVCPAYAGDQVDLKSATIEQFLQLCIYLLKLTCSPHLNFSPCWVPRGQFGGWALGGVFLPAGAFPRGTHTPPRSQQSCVLTPVCAGWHLTKGHFAFLAFFQRRSRRAWCVSAAAVWHESLFWGGGIGGCSCFPPRPCACPTDRWDEVCTLHRDETKLGIFSVKWGLDWCYWDGLSRGCLCLGRDGELGSHPILMWGEARWHWWNDFLLVFLGGAGLSAPEKHWLKLSFIASYPFCPACLLIDSMEMGESWGKGGLSSPYICPCAAHTPPPSLDPSATASWEGLCERF